MDDEFKTCEQCKNTLLCSDIAKCAESSKYQVGSWWLIDYGGSWDKYYIAEIADTMIRFSCRSWLASSGFWFTRAKLESRGAIYLGSGAKKWYWRFLPWRNLLVPFKLPASN